MKYVLMVAAITLLACSLWLSNSEAFDTLKCYESARIEAGQGAEVFAIPDEKYRFIVRDARGDIWYYETMSITGTKVTSKVMVVPARRAE